jgi:hypothetical protein
MTGLPGTNTLAYFRREEEKGCSNIDCRTTNERCHENISYELEILSNSG